MKKVCTKCKVNKSLEDYYKRTSTKDGKFSECKSCTIIRISKYQRSHKGKLAKAKATAKYAKSDKGKLTINEYFKSDKGKAAKARVVYNRRTNILNSLNTLTDKEFNCILFLQNYQCANPNCECGRFFDILKPTLDHIYPVSKGGDFTKETVQALCKSCDSRKGIKYIDYRSEYHKHIIKYIYPANF